MLISNTNVTFKYERYLFLQQTARHSMPVELLLKPGGSQFLKTKYIPASKHQFFRFFQRF